MCSKPTGLAQNLSSSFASEVFVPGKSTILPDQEMTDSDPIRTGNNSLKANTPVELASEASSFRKVKEVVREKTTESAKTPAKKFAVPASKGTASTTAREFPSELQSVIEAEKSQTA